VSSLTVILDTIPDDPNNELARQELRKIPGVTIREVVLPATFKGYVEFPNISLPCEGDEPPTLRGWGLEGIQRFVQDQLRRKE
jgi:hypothetical protein